jgi:hypothetical protein
MIQVPEQQLDVTLPQSSVRMLIAQPFLESQAPIQEPFALRPECAARMLAAIDNLFAVAGTFHPHFIVLPEFSLPGVAGVERVIGRLSSAAVTNPTILIAGVSGLARDEYARLCTLQGVTAPDAVNAPASVPDAEWINASVTFVKDDRGATSVWVQPKISPSWPEANTQHQSMFQGSVVRVFRARFDNDVPCRFLSVLCFDWVGRENGLAVPEALLDRLDTAYRATGSQQAVQWIFVLQHNQQPNHYTFLNSTNKFLTQTAAHPFVLRNDTAVIMACTASARVPARGGTYGYSSLVFSPRAPFETNACPPTFATQASRLRTSNALGTCKDVVFREMGECIHAAEVRVPNFVVPDPTDRTPALVRAEAHPLSGTAAADPRLPGCGVPAVVKWANDELDGVPDLCTLYFTGTTLEGQIRNAQNQVVAGYRQLRSQDLAIRIDGACASRATKAIGNGDPAADVDTSWDADERRGLNHVIQTLTLIGGAAQLDLAGAHLHARDVAGRVEIAAIYGSTHSICVSALKRLAERTHSPIVFVSRDDNNVPHSPREAESFADPRQGAGVRFTDSQTLLQAARSKTLPEYTQFITELLNVQDRHII